MIAKEFRVFKIESLLEKFCKFYHSHPIWNEKENHKNRNASQSKVNRIITTQSSLEKDPVDLTDEQ